MRFSCDVPNLKRIKFSTLLDCLCAQYFHWLKPTVTGLKIVDTDGDTQITGDEFMAYVQGSERVNQKWLSRATEEQPCMLRNAQYTTLTYILTFSLQRHKRLHTRMHLPHSLRS